MNNTILFRKTPLKAQNDYIFSKFVGGMAPLPPWLRLWPLSPVKLILTFPAVIFRKNEIKQRLLEESIIYRKVLVVERVNLHVLEQFFVS